MDIIASEPVDTFDRNGWSTSIGMSGQNLSEYAPWGSSSSIPLQSTTAVGFSVPDSSEWWTTSRNHGHDPGIVDTIAESSGV